MNNDWQPAILKAKEKVTCPLHARLLDALPPEILEQRETHVGKPLRIRPACRVHAPYDYSNTIPNGDCYPVEIMNEKGQVAGGFSCEFYTD